MSHLNQTNSTYGFPDNRLTRHLAAKYYTDISRGNSILFSQRDLGFEGVPDLFEETLLQGVKKTFLLCAIPPGRFALHYFTIEPGNTKSEGCTNFS